MTVLCWSEAGEGEREKGRREGEKEGRREKVTDIHKRIQYVTPYIGCAESYLITSRSCRDT